MVSFLRSSLIALASVALVLLIAQPAFGSRAHNGFFNSLTDEQKDQVSEILHSGKPKAEIKENLRQWVSTQPKEVQEAFQAAEKSQATRRQKIQARRQQLMSKISEEGKKLDQALLAIYQDQNLTKKQTCEQASALIKEASEQVKKELKLKDLECDF